MWRVAPVWLGVGVGGGGGGGCGVAVVVCFAVRKICGITLPPPVFTNAFAQSSQVRGRGL